MIETLYVDDIYRARYECCLLAVTGDPFETSSTHMLQDTDATLVGPCATRDRAGYSFLGSANDFYDAVEFLTAHAGSRDASVNA